MRKTFAALVGATTAIMVSGAGMAAAGVRPAATTEYFQEMSASPTSNRANVIAYGAAFTAAGFDVENSNNTDTFKFPGGSFLVTPKYGAEKEHLDQANCLLTENLRLTYKISHGAGRFTGISGSGHAIIADLEILARNSHRACSMSKTPRAQQVFASGHGRVTLP
jgi:hypothetical protein